MLLYIYSDIIFFMDRRKNNNAAHLKKSAKEKKQPITIYETGIDIDRMGGLHNVRRILQASFKMAKKDYENHLNSIGI